MQAASLRFSPALWRRGRGANLKPRLSQAASLATERPPRNMRLSLHPSLPREVNIQATEGLRCLRRSASSSGAKAQLPCTHNGTAEAVPLQGLFILRFRLKPPAEYGTLP